MIDAGLRAAGHRSARYTSPHLVDLAERFVIDGRPVAADKMLAAVADVQSAIEALLAEGVLQTHPTFFEVTTAVAFELFRRAGVDAAVLEVGLGGRLDATNVIRPVATAITSIAYDHQQYLGPTLAEIAREKAGIIKPRVPMVVGELEPEAFTAIAGIARDRGAPLIRAAEGVTISRARQNTIALRTPARDYGDITMGWRGSIKSATRWSPSGFSSSWMRRDGGASRGRRVGACQTLVAGPARSAPDCRWAEILFRRGP